MTVLGNDFHYLVVVGRYILELIHRLDKSPRMCILTCLISRLTFLDRMHLIQSLPLLSPYFHLPTQQLPHR